MSPDKWPVFRDTPRAALAARGLPVFASLVSREVVWP
jgi:hypothetical protein